MDNFDHEKCHGDVLPQSEQVILDLLVEHRDGRNLKHKYLKTYRQKFEYFVLNYTLGNVFDV